MRSKNYENRNKIKKDSDDEKKQEKIGIIETYDIDDIDEFDNDIQRLNEEKIKITKQKPKKKILTKQIINTLDSINSDSIEIKEAPNTINNINIKEDSYKIKEQKDLLENNNYIRKPKTEKESNPNIKQEEKEKLDNNIDVIQSKEKKINKKIFLENISFLYKVIIFININRIFILNNL